MDCQIWAVATMVAVAAVASMVWIAQGALMWKSP